MFAGHILLIERSPRGVGKERDGVDPHVPSVALSIRTCVYFFHWGVKRTATFSDLMCPPTPPATIDCYLFLNSPLKNFEGTKK